MSELGSKPEEGGMESWGEPSTATVESQIEPNTHLESPEMAAIRTRVEQGEQLTVELLTEYQMLGEQACDQHDDSSREMATYELQRLCAELAYLGDGDMKDAALESLAELQDTTLQSGFDSYSKQISARIAELSS